MLTLSTTLQDNFTKMLQWHQSEEVETNHLLQTQYGPFADVYYAVKQAFYAGQSSLDLTDNVVQHRLALGLATLTNIYPLADVPNDHLLEVVILRQQYDTNRVMALNAELGVVQGLEYGLTAASKVFDNMGLSMVGWGADGAEIALQFFHAHKQTGITDILASSKVDKATMEQLLLQMPEKAALPLVFLRLDAEATQAWVEHMAACLGDAVSSEDLATYASQAQAYAADDHDVTQLEDVMTGCTAQVEAILAHTTPDMKALDGDEAPAKPTKDDTKPQYPEMLLRACAGIADKICAAKQRGLQLQQAQQVLDQHLEQIRWHCKLVIDTGTYATSDANRELLMRNFYQQAYQAVDLRLQSIREDRYYQLYTVERERYLAEQSMLLGKLKRQEVTLSECSDALAGLSAHVHKVKYNKQFTYVDIGLTLGSVLAGSNFYALAAVAVGNIFTNFFKLNDEKRVQKMLAKWQGTLKKYDFAISLLEQKKARYQQDLATNKMVLQNLEQEAASLGFSDPEKSKAAIDGAIATQEALIASVEQDIADLLVKRDAQEAVVAEKETGLANANAELAKAKGKAKKQRKQQKVSDRTVELTIEEQLLQEMHDAYEELNEEKASAEECVMALQRQARTDAFLAPVKEVYHTWLKARKPDFSGLDKAKAEELEEKYENSLLSAQASQQGYQAYVCYVDAFAAPVQTGLDSTAKMFESWQLFRRPAHQKEKVTRGPLYVINIAKQSVDIGKDVAVLYGHSIPKVLATLRCGAQTDSTLQAPQLLELVEQAWMKKLCTSDSPFLQMLSHIGTKQFITEFGTKALELGAKLSVLATLVAGCVEKSQFTKLHERLQADFSQLKTYIDAKFDHVEGQLASVAQDITRLKLFLASALDETMYHKVASMLEQQDVKEYKKALFEALQQHERSVAPLTRIVDRAASATELQDAVAVLETDFTHLCDENLNGALSVSTGARQMVDFPRFAVLYVPILAKRFEYAYADKLPNVALYTNYLPALIQLLSRYRDNHTQDVTQPLPDSLQRAAAAVQQQGKVCQQFFSDLRKLAWLAPQQERYLGALDKLKQVTPIIPETPLSIEVTLDQSMVLSKLKNQVSSSSGLDAVLTDFEKRYRQDWCLPTKRFCIVEFLNYKSVGVVNTAAEAATKIAVIGKFLDAVVEKHAPTLKMPLKKTLYSGRYGFAAGADTALLEAHRICLDEIVENYRSSVISILQSSDIDRAKIKEVGVPPAMLRSISHQERALNTQLTDYVDSVKPGLALLAKDQAHQDNHTLIPSSDKSQSFPPLRIPTQFMNLLLNQTHALENLNKVVRAHGGKVSCQYSLAKSDAGELTWSLQFHYWSGKRAVLAQTVDICRFDTVMTRLYAANPFQLLLLALYGMQSQPDIGLPGKGTVVLAENAICPQEYPFTGLIPFLRHDQLTGTFVFKHEDYNTDIYQSMKAQLGALAEPDAKPAKQLSAIVPKLAMSTFMTTESPYGSHLAKLAEAIGTAELKMQGIALIRDRRFNDAFKDLEAAQRCMASAMHLLFGQRTDVDKLMRAQGYVTAEALWNRARLSPATFSADVAYIAKHVKENKVKFKEHCARLATLPAYNEKLLQTLLTELEHVANPNPAADQSTSFCQHYRERIHITLFGDNRKRVLPLKPMFEQQALTAETSPTPGRGLNYT